MTDKGSVREMIRTNRFNKIHDLFIKCWHDKWIIYNPRFYFTSLILYIYYITLLHFALHSYINNILQYNHTLLYTSIFYGNTDKIVDRAGKNRLDFYSL